MRNGNGNGIKSKANPTGAEHTDAAAHRSPVAEISRLGDQDLLLKAKSLAAEERKITASLLVHLREIEKRRLFAKLGFGSLFAYVTEELGYCGASAQARIAAMRLMNQVPELEEKIITGRVTLTNLAQAQRYFHQEQKTLHQPVSLESKKEVLEKIEGLSSREAVKELMSLSSAPEALARPDRIQLLTPTLSEIRFTADQELIERLDQIRGLLAHQEAKLSLGELITKISEIALERLQARRRGGGLEKVQSVNPQQESMKSPGATQGVAPAAAQTTSRTKITSCARTEGKSQTFKASSGPQTDATTQACKASSPIDSTAATEMTSPTRSPSCAKQSAATAACSPGPTSNGTSNNSSTATTTTTITQTRYIPAATRRAVFERDGFVCSYQDPHSGRRCSSRFALELDHCTPFAKGGASTLENLRIRCRAHNQYAAVQEYGPAKMASHQSSRDQNIRV